MPGEPFLRNSYETVAHTPWNTQQIEQFLPLVKRIAGRIAMSLPSHVEEDDLVGYGVFGLLDAVERFDPGRGVKFETYATLRIRGAVLDGLRAMDWVPHSARQKVRRVQEAYVALEGRLGRAATTQEVADSLRMGSSELEGILKQGQMLVLLSFDEMLEGNGENGPTSSLEDPEAQAAYEEVEKEEQQQLLAEAIEKLPEKERLVVALYYQEELTLKEIAAVMSLSEGRISQIHSQAVARLKGKLSWGRKNAKVLGGNCR